MNFLRVSKTELEKSAKLAQEIFQYDVHRNGSKVKAIEAEIATELSKFESAKVARDELLIVEIWQRIEKLRGEKSLLESAPRRAYDSMTTELKMLSMPVINKASDLLSIEIKRVLATRTFQVLERKYSHSKDSRLTRVKHNFYTVQKEVDRLLAVIRDLRAMELAPLAKIVEVFEKTFAEVPESFALNDEAELSPGQLMDFLEVKNSQPVGYDPAAYPLQEILAESDVGRALRIAENAKARLAE